VDGFAKTVVDQYHPDVIINLGYGRNTIEAWAENKTDGPDAAGVERHSEPADPDGPQWLQTTLPEQDIEKALDQVEDPSYNTRLHLRADPDSVPQDKRLEEAKQAQAEDSGNKYLCNYLNYRMLEATRGQGISSGFFHVDETTQPQELEAVLQQCTIAKLKERQTVKNVS
jgi:pyrrolidone-carboxylate peptidase